MKKTIYRVAAITFAMGMILTNCSTPTEKVQEAKENVAEANKDLDKAQEEYLTDIDNCRKATDEKIAANDQSIADFKTRIADEKKEAKADYNSKIAALEQKNSDMKKHMDEYKAEGKEKWEKFKTEFNHDMEELGKAFKDLTVKNVK